LSERHRQHLQAGFVGVPAEPYGEFPDRRAHWHQEISVDLQ
jgi:hypothetical protein